MHTSHSTRPKQIVIIGAGLAGLSTAWHLQKRGVSCQLFERESEVGGLCRSKRIGDFTFDCCGHLIHSKHPYALQLIRQLLGDNLGEHKRNSWIYSHGRYTHYPFQANLYGLPSAIVKECLVGFIEASKKSLPRHPGNFLEWICATFGKGIARHFMIPYNKKFWTVAPAEMNCSWLEGFIPIPSLRQIIEGTIRDTSRPFGYNAHFWYPKRGGINQLPLAFARQVKKIHTNSAVTEIDLVKKVITTQPAGKSKFDILISTIPLPELAHLIKDMPAAVRDSFRTLRWNSIFNLNVGVDRRDYAGRHWVYFPARDVSFFRVGFFNNFSPSLVPQNCSSVYAEVAYSAAMPLDRNRAVPRIMDDLKKVGILPQGGAVLAEDINDIQYGYPIYDRNYHRARDVIVEYLDRHSVALAGRYGAWRYMSMEDVILDGKVIADSISDNHGSGG